VTPAVSPADQRRRPRQLSLAGDLARRDVSDRLGREVEPARRDVRPRPARPLRTPKAELIKDQGAPPPSSALRPEHPRARRYVDIARPEDAEQRRLAGVRIGCSDGEGPTLEALLSGVWEGLLTAGVADCPVCGAEMKREGAGGSEAAGAACSSCGSKLN
jgi:hypothetical protein